MLTWFEQKFFLRNHRVVDHMASQITVNFNITGSNRFDLAIEEVEDGVMSPCVPPLVQGNWAKVDDVCQCTAVCHLDRRRVGRSPSLSEIVRREEHWRQVSHKKT